MTDEKTRQTMALMRLGVIWNMNVDIQYALTNTVKIGYGKSSRHRQEFSQLVRAGVLTAKEGKAYTTYRLTDLGREWLIKQLSNSLGKPVDDINLLLSIEEYHAQQFLKLMERANLRDEVDRKAPHWNRLNKDEQEALLQLSFQASGKLYYRTAEKRANDYRALKRQGLVDMDADGQGSAFWHLTEQGKTLLLALPDGVTDRLAITRRNLNPQPPAPPEIDPEYPLSGREYIEKYNLPPDCFRVLPDIVKTKRFSSGMAYSSVYVFADVAPDENQRAAIRKNATISKSQACKLFDIKPADFDKAKKRFGLEIVKRGMGESGHIYYLYSFADVVDTLTKAGLIKEGINTF